jgi:hypothetical protein
MVIVRRSLVVAALASGLALLACGSDPAPAVDVQCRDTCAALAAPDCQPHCADKCRGACLAAPSDLQFEFAATTKVICAPDGSAVTFEIERDGRPTLLACH